MTDKTGASGFRRCSLLTARSGLLLFLVGTVGLIILSGCLGPSPATQQTMQAGHQAMVHHKGHEVMPFDLSKTLHIFEMTESGGIQQVIAKDPGDIAQITLIRQHLQHESMRFSAGDFSDPASLHGAHMPGLKELAAGAARIKVEYSALPNGAQITFTTQDLHLITEIHRWFGAQLSDHGPDATYR